MDFAERSTCCVSNLWSAAEPSFAPLRIALPAAAVQEAHASLPPRKSALMRVLRAPQRLPKATWWFRHKQRDTQLLRLETLDNGRDLEYYFKQRNHLQQTWGTD
ncbi:uncharacterized protein LOC142795575 [Rhipicephalus microplus]|uniref:uncharacterized protein LOC142795575 n=1 Tax=Rhipicephalus microplus TaxID=6941 RepID=UPI003F6D2BFE